MALGVDKVDDEYLVSAQVVVPGEVSSTKGGTGRSPVILFQAKGERDKWLKKDQLFDY